MAILINVLASGVVDGSGNPLSSGKAYIYEVGTTTPVAAYQDADLTTPHTNPIILDAVGKAEAYVNQDVRVLIQSSTGTTIQDIDAIGTTTALTNEVITIGGSASDILELNSSITGDVLPTLDNTYVVGNSTKRWKEGRFVNIYGDIQGGIINSMGAKTPGWISNLGITYSAGTFTITAADGNTLSTSNPGYVTVPSTTAGQYVTLKVTQSASFIDDVGASSLTNRTFGISSGIDWQNDMPFWIYVVNKGNADIDGTDGHSFFGFSRTHAMSTTSSNTALIKKTGAAGTANNLGTMMLIGDMTTNNYISLPVQLIGVFRMRYLGGTLDWTVQTLGATDGLGEGALSKSFSTQWQFPVSQNGAATGTHLLSNGGTAPLFTTNNYYYIIHRTNLYTCYIDLSGDGGTDGAGAVQTLISMPIEPDMGAKGQWVAPMATTSTTGANQYVYAQTSTGAAWFSLYTTTAFNTFNLSNFTNGGRSISGIFTYRAAIST